MKITIFNKKSRWIFLISFLAVLTGSFLIPEQRYKSILGLKKNNFLYKAIVQKSGTSEDIKIYKKYDEFEDKYSCLLESKLNIGLDEEYLSIDLIPRSSIYLKSDRTTKYKFGKDKKVLLVPDFDGRGNDIDSWKIPYSEWHKHKRLSTRSSNKYINNNDYDLEKLKKGMGYYIL